LASEHIFSLEEELVNDSWEPRTVQRFVDLILDSGFEVYLDFRIVLLAGGFSLSVFLWGWGVI
jgi:hypothetical protein